MRNSTKDNGKYAVLRFLDRPDSLELPQEVICRNVGCGCGGRCDIIQELDQAGLIAVENGWIRITDEGRAALGHEAPAESTTPVAEE